MRLIDQMRAAFVLRWTIVPASRQENLAEHQWQVAVIARELVHAGADWPLHSIDRLTVAAMFHDMEEVFTGDIPGPAKKTGKVKVEQGWQDDVMIYETGDPSFFKIIIKVADLLQAEWFAHEWLTGRFGKQAAEKHSKIVDEYFEELRDQKHWSWLYDAAVRIRNELAGGTYELDK